MKNYKSPDFEALAATRSNLLGLPDVLDQLRKAGCSRIVLTGSMFEVQEGTGFLAPHDMYDSVYHANDRGRAAYTEQMVHALCQRMVCT